MLALLLHHHPQTLGHRAGLVRIVRARRASDDATELRVQVKSWCPI